MFISYQAVRAIDRHGRFNGTRLDPTRLSYRYNERRSNPRTSVRF